MAIFRGCWKAKIKIVSLQMNHTFCCHEAFPSLSLNHSRSFETIFVQFGPFLDAFELLRFWLENWRFQSRRNFNLCCIFHIWAWECARMKSMPASISHTRQDKFCGPAFDREGQGMSQFIVKVHKKHLLGYTVVRQWTAEEFSLLCLIWKARARRHTLQLHNEDSASCATLFCSVNIAILRIVLLKIIGNGTLRRTERVHM